MNSSATPASKQFSITLTFAPLSITSSGALGGFAPGAAVAGAFTATGGSTPYVWSATGTPASLTLNPATGQLTGTAPTKPGNYTFPLKVTDAETPVASDSTTVSFSVIGFTNPPTLPAGSTATPYSLTFIGAGGTPPYTISSATPPAGLAVASSGLMTGTPTKVGPVTFAVQITDANHISVQSSFTLTVGSGAQPVSSHRSGVAGWHGDNSVLADVAGGGGQAALHVVSHRRSVAAGDGVEPGGNDLRNTHSNRPRDLHSASHGFSRRICVGSLPRSRWTRRRCG